MRHTIWLGCGLLILIVAYFVRQSAEGAVNVGEEMSYDALNFVVIAGAMFCFMMGFRAAMTALQENKESEKMRRVRPPHETKDPLDDNPIESDFDADAALARYMQNRGAEADHAGNPKSLDAAKPSGFGRKSA